MASLSLSSARPTQQPILGFPSRAEIPTINLVEVFPEVSPTSPPKLRIQMVGSGVSCIRECAIPAVVREVMSDTKSSFNGAARLQIKRKLLTVHAANSNSTGGKSPKEESSAAESNAGQGPPFLTILAGFFVFFLVCWIIGSIIMWLIGLIVNVAPK